MTGLLAQWTYHEAEAEVAKEKGKLRCHLFRNKLLDRVEIINRKSSLENFQRMKSIYMFNMRHGSTGHG